MLHAGQNQMASVHQVDLYLAVYCFTLARLTACFPRVPCTCHQGSFLDYDWSDGDLVFANSTCFDDELMANMSAVSK